MPNASILTGNSSSSRTSSIGIKDFGQAPHVDNLFLANFGGVGRNIPPWSDSWAGQREAVYSKVIGVGPISRVSVQSIVGGGF